MTIVPYYAPSNGAAKWTVQMLKTPLKKIVEAKQLIDLDPSLSFYLILLSIYLKSLDHPSL